MNEYLMTAILIGGACVTEHYFGMTGGLCWIIAVLVYMLIYSIMHHN